MSSSRTSRIPSPARSQGSALTPRRQKSRRSRSTGSPARTNASGRLSTLIQEYRERNMGSFVLSPLVRRSMLTDDTNIEEPRRKSWWRKLDENSRDVIEVLEDNKIEEPINFIEELDIDVLSQEKNNSMLDIPESSGSESIQSIVLPQRKLFTEKENHPQKKFGQLIDTRDTLDKQYKTNATTSVNINAAPKELFQNKPRSKPLFPASLLNISPNKTTGDKTLTDIEPKRHVRNIFGNRQGTKRKNMFANFILSESEDESLEIQPKVFGFRRKYDAKRRESSSSRGCRDPSPTSSITTDMELDDWKLLPSSTMVENQLEAMMSGGNTSKRGRLCKLSEAKESDTGTNSTEIVNNTKQFNKFTFSNNKSKTINKEKSLELNSSIRTRSMSIASQNRNDKVGGERQNKSKITNISQSSIVTETKNKSGAIDTKPNASANKSRNNTSKIKNAPIITVKQTENGDEGDKADKQNESPQSLTKNNEYQDQSQEIEQERECEENEIEEQEKEDNQQQDQNQEVQNERQIIQDEVHKEQNQGVHHKSQEKKNESQEIGDESQEGQNESQEVHHESPEIEDESQEVHHESPETEDESQEETHDSQEEHNESKEIQDDSQERQNESEDEKQNVSQEEIEENECGEVNDMEYDNEIEAVDDDESQEEKHGSQEEQNESKEIQDESQERQNESQKMQNESEDEEQNVSQEEIEENECGEVNDMKYDDEIEAVDDDESQEENHGSQEEQNESEEIQDESQEGQNESRKMQNESEDEAQNVSQEENECGKVNDMENNDEIEAVDDDESQEETHDSQEEHNESKEIQDETQEGQNESQEMQNENEDDEQNVSQEEIKENECGEVNDMEYDDENEAVDEEADESDQDDNQENESDQEEVVDQGDYQDNHDSTPNVSHDTTGRNRKKDESPEVILHDTTNQGHSYFAVHGRSTSVRKTKSIIKNLHIRPSVATVRESISLSDGTQSQSKNSNAEGSWDSHGVTRKTLRQTFGKDFTPRKSLRTLVMEKSAKRQTVANDLTSVTAKFPQANSTEFPEESAHQDNVEMDHEAQESDHEVSRRTRQATLEIYLQKIKKQNMEQMAKMREAVRNSLKAPARDTLNPFKVPAKPMFPRGSVVKPSKPKTKKPIKSFVRLEDLPEEIIEDMKYKPPKRFQPANAPWITKSLYSYLEAKLEPKYDYKSRVRAEKLVETIYNFVKDLRRRETAPPDAVEVLKHEMARLNIVKTHYDFYCFFRKFLPRDVRIMIIPDVVNNLPLPRHGPFSDILTGNTLQGPSTSK